MRGEPRRQAQAKAIRTVADKIWEKTVDMSISKWLIECGYVLILNVHWIFLLLASAMALVPILQKWTVKDWLALASLFVLVGFLLNMQPYFQAHVYNDEFYYASIGQNMALNGRACPLIYVNHFSEAKTFDHFQPPYPQGWPYLINIFHKIFFNAKPGAGHFPIWYQAALLNKLLLVGSVVALFIFLRFWYPLPGAWTISVTVAFLPFLLHLAQGASAELAALNALILFALAWASCARSFNWLNVLWLALSAAWLSQMRPEGAVALVLAFFVYACLLKGTCFSQAASDTWKKIGVAFFIFVVFSWSALWAVLVHPPQLEHHFVALARPGLTIWQNRALNLINDGLYFVKNQGWPLTLTLLAAIALLAALKLDILKLTSFDQGKTAVGSDNFQAKAACGAALWLLLITLFLAWYPFGDYACVYSFDSWRFAYVVVVPLASLAAGGFTLLWYKSRKLRLVACFLAILALTPYFLKTASFDSPMQTDYELFLQNAVQTAAYNGVPLVLPDSHLFCPVVYRLGGQAYVVEGLVDYDSRKLKKWRSSWPEDCRIMVVCLYQDKTDNYNLELWDGWKVNLLSQEPITGTGLFLLQKDF